METLLSWISFLLAGCFIGHFCIDMKGVPESISSLVYKMKHKWVWSVWMVAVGMLLFPQLMKRMPEMWQFVGFLMILALIGTALTPIFIKEKEKVHYVLSIVLGILSQVCVLIISPWWILLWLVMVALIIMWINNNIPAWMEGKGLFFVEVICMLALYGSFAL